MNSSKPSPETPDKSELDPLRARIDDLDTQLVQLLSRRAEAAEAIGAIKRADGMAIYDPGREAEVLQKLADANPGPLSDQSVRHIFRQVIAACRNLEETPKVAFLGPEGTFSHQAAFEYFGAEIEADPRIDFSDVAEAVARGEVAWGVLPVENAIEGFVGTTFDLVVEQNLFVVGEAVIPVRLHLVAGCPREDIKVVYSHAQPLKQSRKWLRTHLPQARLIPVESTAAAALRAAEESDAAAIVGPMALGEHQLPVLDGPIEDYPHNRTRFWVVGRQESRQGDKSALMLVLPHEPGTLARALNVFAAHKINLTQIVSRPAPAQPWEYRFFVEMSANPYSDPAAAALRDLIADGAHVRVLGVFAAVERHGD